MFKKILLSLGIITIIIPVIHAGTVPAKPFRGTGEVTEYHAKVHLGQLYRTGHLFEDVANDATAYFMIDVATTAFTSDEIHATVTIVSTAESYVNIYMNPTTTSSGTVVDSWNLNHTIGDHAEAIFYHTPTITDIGTQVSPPILIPYSVGYFNSANWFANEAEYVGTGSLYIIEVVNKSGQAAADIGVYLDFYEKINP